VRRLSERYSVADRIGRGGVGDVYKGWQEALDRPVAIKVLRAEFTRNAQAMRRFEREARTTSRLRHPNVVTVFDVGLADDGTRFLVMELLEGTSLAKLLAEKAPLPIGDALAIARQIVRGMSAGEGVGLVHRDLKPENIFLVRDDDNEIAKVLDFGIAQHATSEPNGAGRSILGTPFYMSPEQASGTTRVDHRSDLFSLAVIVYQCLTGELPFVGEGVQDVFSQILQGPVPIPSQKAADLPPTFDAWWARASARDVSQRYQTAKEFAEALNLSLRISEVLEIASLMPRAEISSAGRISIVAGSLSALGSPQISGGPTLAIHNTLDESFTRTFEPEPIFRKRRLRLYAGIGAAAVVVAALIFSRGGEPAAATTEPATVATVATTNPSPALPESPAAPSAVPPPAERIDSKVSSSFRARPSSKSLDGAHAAPHRSAKPAKPAAVVRTADDFGI
jgi:serine/threonine-protein kinase